MTDNIILLKRVKNGDEKAYGELVENNMKLVMSIAARFVGRGYDYEDLTQIGAMGLMKAIEKFDASYEVKFSTYAVPVIMGEIKRFLRDDGLIKVSRSIKETAMKGKRYAEKLRTVLGREPTISEIAEAGGLNEEDLTQAFEATLPTTSVIVTDEDGKESEIAADENEEERILNKILVADMLASLENRQRQIIVLRYYKGMTQSETAKRVGVSQVQVSRIEKTVIRKLKTEFSI